LKYAKQSLAIREGLRNKEDIAQSLNTIGVIFWYKGDMDKALEYYRLSLALKQELGNPHETAKTLNNIGEVYRAQGQLEQSLLFHHRSLSLKREIGNKHEIAISLLNIGNLHYQKGELDLGLRTLEQSSILLEEIGNTDHLSEALLSMILIEVDENKLDIARLHLQKLDRIDERETNRLVKQRCNLARAIILKKSKRIRGMAKAEELFAEIVEDEIVDQEITVTALLHLCDLLLDALQLYGKDEILLELKNLATRLLGVSKQQKSHVLLAETYVLLSELALLDLDIERATTLLTQAQLIAEEMELRRLAARISAIKQTLLQEHLKSWENLAERNAPMHERLDLVRLKGMFERMLRGRVNLTEIEALKYLVDAKKVVGDYKESITSEVSSPE